jgi:hypothetical protein
MWTIYCQWFSRFLQIYLVSQMSGKKLCRNYSKDKFAVLMTNTCKVQYMLMTKYSVVQAFQKFCLKRIIFRYRKVLFIFILITLLAKILRWNLVTKAPKMSWMFKFKLTLLFSVPWILCRTGIKVVIQIFFAKWGFSKGQGYNISLLKKIQGSTKYRYCIIA